MIYSGVIFTGDSWTSTCDDEYIILCMQILDIILHRLAQLSQASYNRSTSELTIPTSPFGVQAKPSIYCKELMLWSRPFRQSTLPNLLENCRLAYETEA